MTPFQTDELYLKKHDNGEIFGPVPFGRIIEWAGTAQISPQDTLSVDQEVWTKAPMFPELKMDWIVRVDDDHFYGPTTVGTLIEFRDAGEITGETVIIDCCTAAELKFKDTAFFQQLGEESRAPAKGEIRLSLQKRIRELEMSLLDKRRHLDQAAETIRRLETRVAELETRVRALTS
jgi:hypothetical protein